MTQSPINIGQQPQFFFDNYMIEMVNFVTRTMHQPRRHGGNPLIRKDRPWEITPHFRTNCWNVRHDEQERRYKCWYEDTGLDYARALKTRRETLGPIDSRVHDASRHRMLYAESDDGLSWTKPELDYCRVDGRKTNICLGDETFGKVHAFTIIDDPLESDPAQRYKSIFWHEMTNIEDASIRAVYSADGRSWHAYDRPVSFGHIGERALGDVIILYADTVTGQYYLDTRSTAMCTREGNPKLPTGGGWGDPYYPGDGFGMTKRRVFSTNSRDILSWPALDETIVPDDVHDNLDDEFYGLTRFRMGELWVGFLDVFQRTHNTKDVRLVYSRDGYHWTQVSRSSPFLERSAEGNWDCYMVEICNTPLFLDDEIRIYYGGANVHHDWWTHGEIEGLDVPEAKAGFAGGETALGLATLRPEGFVSIDSTVRDGVMITRPFVSQGNRLVVNAISGPSGYLEAELTDADDDVVPGFGRDACDTFKGDSTAHVLSWSGRTDLPQRVLASGAKLRFFSRHTSLYSFRIG